jgi:hypothetical protein
VELKSNATHQLLVYTDDVNLLGDKINTMKKNTEAVIDASKEVGLELNRQKTKYMLKSTIFWDIMPHSPLSVNRCFGGTYRLQLQGRKNKLSKKPG